MVGASLVLLLLLPHDDKSPAKLPLGKETTHVTGPLDKDGYIDYEAALNDRLGKGITPETNASVLLWKAIGPSPDGDAVPDGFFKRLGIDRPPEKGDYFIGLIVYLKEHARLDRQEFRAIDDQQGEAVRRLWAAKDYPHLAAWLRANEKPLAVIVEATRRPDYYNPLVTRNTPRGRTGLAAARIPAAQQCREVARALAARAMLRAGEGKFGEAWQDLLACHRLGRLVARGGTLVEPLIGYGIEQLAKDADLAYLDRAGLTAEQARACLKDLRDLPAVPGLDDKFDLTERFTYLDSVQLVHRYGLKALRDRAFEPPAEPGPKELKALAGIDWEPTLRYGNRLFDRTAAALRMDDRPKRVKELERIWAEIVVHRNEAMPDDEPRGGILGGLLGGKRLGPERDQKLAHALVSLLFPWAEKVQDAKERAGQVGRNLCVAFALAAYRADHGRYPAKLDELAPKYLAAVPDDLFSGKPL
ncbi:MAG TPA: hypothetical protein VFW33_12820, partial [Gemmataceae bacterium]|nr:hypothetical protein [Gemmataceae bacterium]